MKLSVDHLRVVYGVTVGGSADSFLNGQLAYLREQGWDVHLATTPDERAHVAAVREGVTLQPIPMEREISPLADLRALLTWVRLLRRLRPDATNVGTPKAGLLGGVAAWLTRVPRRVYTLHGLRLEGASGPKAGILWLMEWVSLHCATDVLMVSSSLAEAVQQRNLLRPGRALIINQGSCNGVPGEEISQRVAGLDRSALRAELGFQDSEVVVGYVGRIAADKGLDVLFAALRQIPDAAGVRLLLVGGLEDPTLTPIIEAAGSKCVSVGWQDDVVPYYAAMDLMCLPTRREGLPTVVLEASAAGIPTVSTLATGARDAVVNGITGISVEVDDIAALAYAITSLATDKSRRQTMGDAARTRVLREFQPRVVWEGIESVMRGESDAHVVLV